MLYGSTSYSNMAYGSMLYVSMVIILAVIVCYWLFWIVCWLLLSSVFVFPARGGVLFLSKMPVGGCLERRRATFTTLVVLTYDWRKIMRLKALKIAK